MHGWQRINIYMYMIANHVHNVHDIAIMAKLPAVSALPSRQRSPLPRDPDKRDMSVFGFLVTQAMYCTYGLERMHSHGSCTA